MDLEEYALRRDKKFLVRLILMLTVGILFGSFVFMKLTNEDVGSCAAGAFGNLSGTPPSTVD